MQFVREYLTSSAAEEAPLSINIRQSGVQLSFRDDEIIYVAHSKTYFVDEVDF